MSTEWRSPAWWDGPEPGDLTCEELIRGAMEQVRERCAQLAGLSGSRESRDSIVPLIRSLDLDTGKTPEGY